MAFNTTYSAGGQLDKVTVIEEVKKVNLPAHLFPTKTRPFTKGFRIEVPTLLGPYTKEFTPDVDMELLDVSLACSGYGDDDYWELEIGEEKIIETMYTKELPQHINTGTNMYTVEHIPAGTTIKLSFYNTSQTSKTVWFDLRFLK